jgi:hypothetical protein
MNESNPPLFLPSGYIISEKGRQLLLLAEKERKTESMDLDDEQFRCPVTNVPILNSEVRKIFFS